jgi:hypothetical protein
MVGSYEPLRVDSASGEVTSGDGRQQVVSATLAREHHGEIIRLSARGVPSFQLAAAQPVLVLKPYRTPGGFIFKPGFKNTFPALDKYRAELQPVWVPAGEVRERDFLLSPRMALTATDAPVTLTPDVAWLLGLYVAEGHTAGRNSFGMCLGVKADYARAMRALEDLGLRPSLTEYPTYRRIRVNSVETTANFRSWFGANSTSKKIPAWLHGAYARDALAGYLHGDGYIHPRGQQVPYTTSLQLAWQVWQLAVGAGEQAHLNQIRQGGEPYCINGATGTASPGWNIEWRTSTQHYNDWWGDYYCLTVTDIDREAYDGPLYSLDVTDHSYLANGAVVMAATPSAASFIARPSVAPAEPPGGSRYP